MARQLQGQGFQIAPIRGRDRRYRDRGAHSLFHPRSWTAADNFVVKRPAFRIQAVGSGNGQPDKKRTKAALPLGLSMLHLVERKSLKKIPTRKARNHGKFSCFEFLEQFVPEIPGGGGEWSGSSRDPEMGEGSFPRACRSLQLSNSPRRFLSSIDRIGQFIFWNSPTRHGHQSKGLPPIYQHVVALILFRI